ncbi:rhamnose mutarotase [Punctularia strigosozonata HHB-11173 SS5]|uniref:rhamnose mutarotase n=1 Tax=Punctularia strigosozonata (strain HHB-11173) TaxID=741275 RepID=UPI00044183B3|nr:rhamnose mutarotase [Punctularia strigosozonata HHB-11173 SS5]EIN08000.1 rhamnose mutarotase [Punctularia strigosozonata HHB-11173 SS5]
MSTTNAKRICQIIKLRPEHAEEYKKIHSAVWPGVLSALERHHIVDYSIHYYPPLNLLIANMKYTGTDYDEDMAGIAEDPETNRWWAVTDGMQESFNAGATGSKDSPAPWWTELEEVFRFEGKA